MAIQDEIDWLRDVEKYPNVDAQIGDLHRQCANTMEKLLAVYEAAESVLSDAIITTGTIYEGEAPEAEALKDAVSAVQTEQSP